MKQECSKVTTWLQSFFLFIMQAVMETLDKDLPANNNKPEFCYFPNDKGCLTGQRTKSAGTSFNICGLLFINDGAFLFQCQDKMEKATQIIHDHFKKFGLQMHIRSKETKSKTEAVSSPTSLKEATENMENKTLPEDLLLNDGNNNIHFTWKFRYLGAHIMTEMKMMTSKSE